MPHLAQTTAALMVERPQEYVPGFELIKPDDNLAQMDDSIEDKVATSSQLTTQYVRNPQKLHSLVAFTVSPHDVAGL